MKAELGDDSEDRKLCLYMMPVLDLGEGGGRPQLGLFQGDVPWMWASRSGNTGGLQVRRRSRVWGWEGDLAT